MEILKTKSVCPECKRIINAELFSKDEIIYMKKNCPDHGEFIERIYDLKQFDKVLKYLEKLHQYIPTKEITVCPYACETCTAHLSPTVLGIVDVTNRCNLRCSYCFANAETCGWLYEPDAETIKKEIDYMTKMSPPAPAVLFSGGEPTIRDDFPELVRYARDKGLFILVATNGYKIASSLEYTRELAEAGVSTLYLSFDGLTDESNKEKKNHLIIDKIMDNCKRTGIGIVLVPAVIRGFNEDQILPLIKFASEHLDVIRGVNFQPISFCGRMSREQREEERYTISDLTKDVEKQSNGVIKIRDWYPVPSVLPMTNLFECITGEKGVTFSSHPLCGSATYLFKDENGNLIPFSEFVDTDRFIEILENYGNELNKIPKLLRPIKILNMLRRLIKTIDAERKPKNLMLEELIKDVIFNPGNMEALTNFHLNTLFVGTMHFQDLYNADIERIKYCTIHYITPDCTRIPFCAYNGFGHRDKVEQRHRREYKK